jgi:hypothetical protein
MIAYIALPELAALAGISERAVEKAVARSRRDDGYCWRSTVLVSRTVRGRGGRSGLRYEVRVDSLPIELQQRFKQHYGEALPQLSHGLQAQEERDFRYYVISPALAHPKGSNERGAAIRDIAGRDHRRSGKKPGRLSERTIQRWLDDHEVHGLAGLGRAKRVDAGRRMAIVSRRWDAAVTFDDAEKHRIERAVREYVAGLHAAGESAAILAELAALRLQKLTSKAGCDLAIETCRLPSHFIGGMRVHRRQALKSRDRKAYEDQKPRIRRTREGMAPMAIIVGDVHPVDIVLSREDGSTAHARAIGWLDMATNRIWLDLILLDKGKGITNAHVIRSFINMVEAWGAPRALYLDNGSEYNWAPFIDDALQLIGDGGRRLLGTAELRASQITRAQPYNAAAKPIEGIFAVLERTYFQAIPGWIAGDRMKKKASSVGGKVEPFPGSFDDFRTIIDMQLALYHRMPQRGTLKGRSPDQVYVAAIASGWEKTAVDAKAFVVAFSTEVEKTVRQGAITHDGDRWTCAELIRWQEAKITVRIPKYEGWRCLPLYDRFGELVGLAERDRAYHPFEKAGAIEARERSRLHGQEVRALGHDVPKLNLLHERAGLLASQPPSPEAPTGTRLVASEQAMKIVAHLDESPKAREARLHQEYVARVKADIALHEDFFKNRRSQN